MTNILRRTPAERRFFQGFPRDFFHNEDRCQGRNCVIHRPSDHAMRQWAMRLRASTLVERLCPHNISHPDPDSASFLNYYHYGEEAVVGGFSVHGCDGCCIRHPKTIRENW